MTGRYGGILLIRGPAPRGGRFGSSYIGTAYAACAGASIGDEHAVLNCRKVSTMIPQSRIRASGEHQAPPRPGLGDYPTPTIPGVREPTCIHKK